MNSKTLALTALTLGSLALADAAHAALITADSSWAGQGSVTVGGATFGAYTDKDCTVQGTFGTRSIPNVGTGVGVAGAGNNEIDYTGSGRSEAICVSFGQAVDITNLSLGLLFDGPEYSDFQEVAVFRVEYEDGSTSLYTLSAVYNGGSTTYTWNGSGSWSSSGTVNGGAGLWTGANPFSNVLGIIGLDMYAAAGVCAPGLTCSDQSDYVFRSLTTAVRSVPEPATLGLLGLGLLGLGAVRRR